MPQNAEEGDGTDTLLKRVQTYIRNHYTERLTLADIAEAVHVSPSYLSRFYKLKAGENLFDTINSLRVEKAKELLLRGDKKIYEIAALTGLRIRHIFQRCLRNMQDVRQRNTSSPEEEIYEKRNVGLLLLMTACLLGGCSKESAEQTEITLIHGWGSMESEHVRMRQIYKDFEKEHPEIKLNLMSMTSSDEVIKKTKNMLSVGEVPDLIFTGGYGKDSVYRFMEEKNKAADLCLIWRKIRNLQTL